MITIAYRMQGRNHESGTNPITSLTFTTYDPWDDLPSGKLRYLSLGENNANVGDDIPIGSLW